MHTKPTLYFGDCLPFLKQMPDKSVNLIVTDPPYGIGYKSNSGSRKYQRRVHNFEWDAEFDFTVYWNECYRVLADNSHAYVFGTWENFELMRSLKGFEQVLVWDKRHNGMGDLKRWGIGYELIFFFQKGKRALHKRKNGVIAFEFYGHFEKTIHPTQKPEGLARIFIENSSNLGETVLDPFMGSGTFGVDALLAGRQFIGCERDEKYFKRAKTRVEIANEQTTLAKLTS